jgi:hypothetical protein
MILESLLLLHNILFQICSHSQLNNNFNRKAANFTVDHDINVLKSVLKQKLLDQYIQHWFQQINSSSRGEFYGIFKTEFKLEPYLINVTLHRDSIPFNLYNEGFLK